MDVEPVSSDDSFSMRNVPAGQPPEQDFLLDQLQSLSSSGITGQKALGTLVHNEDGAWEPAQKTDVNAVVE